MNTRILNQLYRIRKQEYKKLLEQLHDQIGTKDPVTPATGELKTINHALSNTDDEDIQYERMVENYKKLANLLILIFKNSRENKVYNPLQDEIIEEIKGKIKAYIPEQPIFKPLTPFLFLRKNQQLSEGVSIILLNENGAGSIQSILNNFLNDGLGPDFRIILADRASTDKSIEIAGDYLGKLPLDILPFDQRFSRSYILNTAADHCQTKYLLFIDHRMIFRADIPGRLMKMYEQQENTGIAGAGVIKNNDLSTINGFARFTFKKTAGVPDIPFPTINLSLLARCGIEDLLPYYRKE